jgi:hypothetical protein
MSRVRSECQFVSKLWLQSTSSKNHVAQRKFNELNNLVPPLYVEYRTIDLKILNRIITDVLLPEIRTLIAQPSDKK